MIREEVNIAANVESGKIDINDSAVRDTVNSLIEGVTSQCFLTPYIALERVAKVLANFHIYLPKYTFMEGDSGLATFPVHQFGEKVGMTNDGQVVTKPVSPFTLWFEYQMNDKGTYEIFSAVVDGDELRDLMSDLNDDMEDLGEAVVRPETGPRKVPGSSCDTGVEMEDEDQTSENMPDLIKSIIRRAMKPGLKFAGDEAGPKQKPSTSLTESKKKSLSEVSAFGQAYQAARQSGQSTFTFGGKSFSSDLDKKPAAPTTPSVPMPKSRPAGADTALPSPSPDAFKPKLSAYSPQKGGDKMEGGYASARPGPDKQSVVRTLDDYASGRSQHVTLAGHPSQYGKEYTIPSMKYTNAAGEEKELKNVRGVVHDTGSAFKGKDAESGQRFDVAVGRDYASKQLSGQPWSMKSDVEFKPGWTPSEPEKKIQTASLDENMPAQTLGEKPKPAQWNLEEDDDTPDSVIPKTSSTSQPSQAERQAGMEKLKGAMNTQIKQNMDRYVDNLKKQDFINRATQEPPKKGQYDI